MSIKDIILSTARLLNLQHVVDYIKDGKDTGNASSECNKLVELTNLVLTEIGSFGVYAVHEQNITAYNGKIQYSVLHFSSIKILELLRENGEACPYTLHPQHIKCEDGVKRITFSYAPQHKINETFFLSNHEVRATTIAMGVASEYLLTINDFDSAVIWQEKYLEEMKKFIPTAKNTSIKNRSFI